MENNRGLKQFSDIREGLKYLAARKSVYYQIPYPLVPQKYNREYRKGKVKFNPALCLCSCSEFLRRKELFSMESWHHHVCAHLFDFFTDKNLLSDYDRILLWSEVRFGYHNILRIRGVTEGDENDIFLQMPPLDKVEWINVLVKASGSGHYVKHSYSLTENRWSYGIPPEESVRIERVILTAIKSLTGS